MIEMVEVLKEKNVAKHENIFFELVKKAQYKTLNVSERGRFLASARRSVDYLKEEFETVRENENNNGLDYITINNGITLVSDLNEGLNILRTNFIKENINQFAAHYQSVRDYEDGFIAYRYNDKGHKNFSRTIELFTEAKSFADGYQKGKTLTRNS